MTATLITSCTLATRCVRIQINEPILFDSVTRTTRLEVYSRFFISVSVTPIRDFKKKQNYFNLCVVCSRSDRSHALSVDAAATVSQRLIFS